MAAGAVGRDSSEILREVSTRAILLVEGFRRESSSSARLAPLDWVERPAGRRTGEGGVDRKVKSLATNDEVAGWELRLATEVRESIPARDKLTISEKILEGGLTQQFKLAFT